MFGEFFVQSGTEGNEEEQELGDEVGQYIYSLKKKEKEQKLLLLESTWEFISFSNVCKNIVLLPL